MSLLHDERRHVHSLLCGFESHHLSARHHHFVGDGVLELEDTAKELGVILREGAFFLAFGDDPLETDHRDALRVGAGHRVHLTLEHLAQQVHGEGERDHQNLEGPEVLEHRQRPGAGPLGGDGRQDLGQHRVHEAHQRRGAGHHANASEVGSHVHGHHRTARQTKHPTRAQARTDPVELPQGARRHGGVAAPLVRDRLEPDHAKREEARVEGRKSRADHDGHDDDGDLRT